MTKKIDFSASLEDIGEAVGISLGNQAELRYREHLSELESSLSQLQKAEDVVRMKQKARAAAYDLIIEQFSEGNGYVSALTKLRDQMVAATKVDD